MNSVSNEWMEQDTQSSLPLNPSSPTAPDKPADFQFLGLAGSFARVAVAHFMADNGHISVAAKLVPAPGNLTVGAWHPGSDRSQQPLKLTIGPFFENAANDCPDPMHLSWSAVAKLVHDSLELTSRVGPARSQLMESHRQTTANSVPREQPPIATNPPSMVLLPEAIRDPWLGKTLGTYKIKRLIGQGGSGRVYEAQQLGIVPRSYAIKIFSIWNSSNLARFEFEARALERVEHPGLASVYSAGHTEDGIPYLVMKLVRGERLDHWARRVAATPRKIADVIRQVAEAMALVHEHRLLHRDLKPSNIIMSDLGWPVVIDFGLAKTLESDRPVGITDPDMAMGSLGFLAPELSLTDRSNLTSGVDVYGLGATMYFLLTGQTPSRSTDWWECLEDLRTRDAVPVRHLNSAVHPDLESICMRCLERDETRRYQNMDSLAEDLQSWLDNRPVKARRLGALRRWGRWCSRNSVLTTLATSLVLLLLTSTVFFAILWHRASSLSDSLSASNHLIKDQLMAFMKPVVRGFSYAPQVDREEFIQQLINSLPYVEHLSQTQLDNLFFRERLAEYKYIIGRELISASFGINNREYLEQACLLFRELSLDYPHQHAYRFDQYHCYLALCNLSGVDDRTRTRYTISGYELITDLAEQYPHETDYQDAKALQSLLLAKLQYQVVNPWFDLMTLGLVNQALHIACDNCDCCPEKPIYRKHIIGSHKLLADFCRVRGQFQLAKRLKERALEEAQLHYQQEPELSDTLLEIGIIHSELADLAMECFDIDESDKQFAKFKNVMLLGNEAYPNQRLFKTILNEYQQRFEFARSMKLQESFAPAADPRHR